MSPTMSGFPATRTILTTCSIVGNSLVAGAIFTFPLFSPALASHMNLSQPQLTTIVLAGMVGQYPFSAVAGKVIDRYGPAACSLIASILFYLSFGLFTLELSKVPDDAPQSSSTFHHLTALYCIAGLGTVFGYFSSLFAASKTFPNHLGMASGASMAVFGLSPLFLSIFASTFYTDPETGLDVTHFIRFLAILTGTVHLIGAFNMKMPLPIIDPLPTPAPDEEQGAQSDERTQLLPNKPNAETRTPEPLATEEGSSVSVLFRDPYFWLLASVLLLILGACEMVISNLGTIVLSLPSSSIPHFQGPSTDTATSLQVRILSLANTCSRLVVGPLADFISPVASYLHTGSASFPRKHHISRMAFLSVAALLLAFTFLWMEFGVRSQGGIWALSVGIGIAYGTSFTVVPSIVSSIWGLSDLGRNFGIMTYAPFIGTPIFSYLYAFVSAYHSADGGVCRGLLCWQLTFWVTCGTALLAFVGTLVLWKAWKGRV